MPAPVDTSLTAAKFDLEGVLTEDKKRLLYRYRSTGVVRVAESPAGAIGYSTRVGANWAMVRDGVGPTTFLVVDPKTGAIVQSFPPVNGQSTIGIAGGSAKHIFAQSAPGLALLGMDTGEVTKVFSSQECFGHIAQFDGKRFTCGSAAGVFFSVDEDTKVVEALSPAGAYQSDGACNADISLCTWVDHRDPPGQVRALIGAMAARSTKSA